MKDIYLLRLPEVESRLGLTKSAIYDYSRKGLFTRPVVIGKRASAWPDYEIDALISARIAGKSKEDIKKLVDWLYEKRQSLTLPDVA